jgi:hypothetical protein
LQRDWDELTEDEQHEAITYAFDHTTELDKARFRRIIEQRDGPLTLGLPQWVMTIFNRSASDERS